MNFLYYYCRFFLNTFWFTRQGGDVQTGVQNVLVDTFIMIYKLIVSLNLIFLKGVINVCIFYRLGI